MFGDACVSDVLEDGGPLSNDTKMYYVIQARQFVDNVLPVIRDTPFHRLREPSFFGYVELEEATKDSNLWQVEAE